MVLQTPSAGYQGLTNYATWAVNAHLSSDPVLFHEVLHPICTPAPTLLRNEVGMAKVGAADDLRSYAEGLFAGLLDRSVGVTGGQYDGFIGDLLTEWISKELLTDLMRHSMDNVNWREIVDIHWNK